MVKRVKKRNFSARASATMLLSAGQSVTEAEERTTWIERNKYSLHKQGIAMPELFGQPPMDLNRSSLLHMAAIGNDRAIEKIILLKKENVEQRDRNGFSPLHLAVKGGHVKAVQKLIELKADVHAKYTHARTPLHLVGEFGRRPSSTAIVKALVERGEVSDLLVRDRADDTPLHLAALNSNAEVLKGMLEYLSTSSESGLSIEPCSNTTFELNLPDKEGRTPLHFAAGKGNVEATRLLLGKGASKDARDVYGATPFHFAARSGSVEVLKLSQPKDVNDQSTNTQMTALHYAAWNGWVEAVLWLLAHRASVNVKDTVEGDTPLHLAARKGDGQIVEILITEGRAKPDLTNNKGELALGLADDGDYRDAARAFVRAITRKAQKKLRGCLWTKHATNGATWLHYFGAYGIEEDLKWILALIEKQAPSNVAGKGVNIGDDFDRTVVHWAAMKGNKDVISILAKNKASLNMTSPYYHATPLAVALINKEMAFAEELLQHKPKDSMSDSNWLRDVHLNLMDFQDANLARKFASLRKEYKPHDMTHGSVDLFFELPTIYLAIYADRVDIGHFIQEHSKGVDDGVNERGGKSKRTALHWATLLRQREIVTQLCKTDEAFAHALTANEEDGSGMTALQYAKQLGFKDVENELMQRNDVSAYIDAMYKDRQVYVDATNAILVGAALIASVTFAGWLQPPLNYTPYYNLPQLPPPSPPDIFQSYAAVQQHIGVRWFWVFNSLSFSFAIATVLAGLVGVVPIPRIYIATTVAHLRHCLLIAAVLLGLSIVFVLAAFAAAGFAVLPPLFEYQAYMMATVIVGGIPCLFLLAQFACRLLSLRPDWLRAIEIKVFSKLCSGCSRPGESQNASQVLSTHADLEVKSTKLEQKSKYGHAGNDYDSMPWDDGLNLPAQN